MKIFIASMELTSLTGQPMYHYHLAKGLRELGHEVVCVGLQIGGEVTDMFRGIGCLVADITSDKWKGKYDLALIAENIPKYLDGIECDKIFNICHSKNDVDRPILDKRVNHYLAPRQDVIDRWIEDYKDDGLKFSILENPMDFDKWQVKREKQDKYIILTPCTRSMLRRPMLMDLIKRADNDTEVWMVGDEYGALNGLEIPDNVKVYPSTTDVVSYMKKADEVAGIFVGRVTLEAQIMGIKTSVYDEKGNWEYVEPDNLEKHHYKKVAEKFVCL